MRLTKNRNWIAGPQLVWGLLMARFFREGLLIFNL